MTDTSTKKRCQCFHSSDEAKTQCGSPVAPGQNYCTYCANGHQRRTNSKWFTVLWSRTLDDETIVQVVHRADGRKLIEVVGPDDSTLMTDGARECIRFEIRSAADRLSLEMAMQELQR
ncbi:MAG: hypothetical protein JO277_09945 [Candidatus Eremiobacteraeota bacterium]|nr:hypothetical protein [Candidatus Eremiobacteraeota bacterium]